MTFLVQLTDLEQVLLKLAIIFLPVSQIIFLRSVYMIVKCDGHPTSAPSRIAFLFHLDFQNTALTLSDWVWVNKN